MSSEGEPTPLLVLDQARIDGAGGPLLDGVSLTLAGSRGGLVGAFDALFGVMCGRLPLLSGRALVRGTPLRQAVCCGALGVARSDPALPGAWSARDYLTASARLSGLDRARARRTADAVLQGLGLVALSARSIGGFTLAERRALLIAHACIGEPTTLALERPFSGLDEASARAIAELVARAAAGRALLLSSSGLPVTGAERGAFEALDSVVTLAADGALRAGPVPAAHEQGAELVVGVTRGAPELAARLIERGCKVAGEMNGATVALRAHGAARLRVRLGARMTPDDVLAAALELEAPIVELIPRAPGS